MRRATAVLACAALFAAPASAHDGPPYPILVDEPLAGSTVSIWADPDVGTGTFFFYFDRPLGCELRIGARPSDGRLEEAFVLAAAAREGEPFDLVGEVRFDAQGPWSMRFLAGPEGAEGELSVEVDVTPPGLGTIDLLWYASPFLTIAFLWVKVAVKRRQLARDEREPAASVALERPS
jgi:hypothetical protein